ncbi:MAG: glycosyltransferase, partial [Candidatus Dormiibacterota bacterium]
MDRSGEPRVLKKEDPAGVDPARDVDVRPGHPVARSALAVAWAPFQARTEALAEALGGRAAFVSGRLPPLPALAPLRYLGCAWRTWRLLDRRRPIAVVVVTPPVVAPAVAWCWCRLRGCPLIVDCHTDTFHARRWAWARPLLRALFARSRAVLVHTEEAVEIVRGWRVAGLLLPDDVPDGSRAEPAATPTRPTVLVAGSLDANEPVAETLAAARLLPEVHLRFTGDPRGVPRAVRAAAPANVAFTGFLPYRRFLGAMRAAHVVAVFSTDTHIMNRAAFEAAGLGRPLVLSDLAGLRARFGEGAIYAVNDPQEMARSLRLALADAAGMADRSRLLGERLRGQRDDALRRLQILV